MKTFELVKKIDKIMDGRPRSKFSLFEATTVAICKGCEWALECCEGCPFEHFSPYRNEEWQGDVDDHMSGGSYE